MLNIISEYKTIYYFAYITIYKNKNKTNSNYHQSILFSLRVFLFFSIIVLDNQQDFNNILYSHDTSVNEDGQIIKTKLKMSAKNV